MLHKPRGEVRFFVPEGMQANNNADILQDLISIMPIFAGDGLEGDLEDLASLIQLGTMFF